MSSLQEFQNANSFHVKHMPIGIYQHKKGYKRDPLIVEKIRLANTGKVRTLESRKKQSNSRIGKKYAPHSEETKRKIGESNSKVQKGKPKPWKCGKNNHFWKGGISKENDRIRKSLIYRLWRSAVFERDKYTCVLCGKKGGKLQADHVKPFAYFPLERFNIANGRTLCVSCHKQTNTYGRRYKL